MTSKAAREIRRMPLLRDRHTHPFLYAALHQGIDVSGAEIGRTEAVRRVREQARRGLPGWTIAFGWNSGRYALAKEDFDDLSPVVVFNLSLHGLVVNDAGRALLAADDPEVGAQIDDQEWVERNLRRVLNGFANAGASVERLHRFFDWLLREHGVYHAEEMLLVGANEIRLFEEAGLSDRTRFWASPDEYERLPPALQAKVHGIKLFTDGALGAWTAALHQPYRDQGGHGMLMYGSEELADLLGRYLGAGKPMAVHAIGDAAVDQVVSVVGEVGAGAAEFRIEHAQLISEPTARRAKALGIGLCMQPNFSEDSVDYAGRLPAGYPERNNPFRMLIDQVGYVPGEDLFFGSDGMPHGWRRGLEQSLFAKGGFTDQRLTLDEFVAGYCLPDFTVGHLEVEIDWEAQRVSGRVVLP